MGSFNMTCFASQQTIAPGDLCRILPILQQGSYDPTLIQKRTSLEMPGTSQSRCYYDSFWRPAGNFIQGAYDDYGKTVITYDEQTRASMLSLFVDILKYSWVTVQGDNEYHDLPFDFSTFLSERAPRIVALATKLDYLLEELDSSLDEELQLCWEHVWAVGQEHRLYMSDYRGRPRVLTFAIIHEETYAELLDQQTEGLGQSGSPRARETRVLRAMAKGGTDLFNAPAPLEVYGHAFLKFSGAIQELISRADGVGQPLCTAQSNMLDTYCRAFCDNKLAKERFISRCMLLLENRCVLASLDSLNLRITPAVSADQDYENSVGCSYAKFVTAVSAKVTRGRQLLQFGPFNPYLLQGATSLQVEQLITTVPRWNAAIENITVAPNDKVLFNVQFDCTLELEDLQELIAEIGSKPKANNPLVLTSR